MIEDEDPVSTFFVKGTRCSSGLRQLVSRKEELEKEKSSARKKS